MSSLFPSDINECAMGIDGCDPRGSCVNTAGSFQCTCDSLTGFQLGSDQRTCVGTYACVLLCFTVFYCVLLCIYTSFPLSCSSLPSSSLPAPPSLLPLSCSSLPSSSLLLLPPFFPMSPSLSVYTQPSQSDVNECAQNTDNCQQLCNNTVGSFTCSCETGYVLEMDGFTCTLNGTTGETA